MLTVTSIFGYKYPSSIFRIKMSIIRYNIAKLLITNAGLGKVITN